MAKTTEEELKAMRAEVDRLTAALDIANAGRTEAEAMSAAMAFSGNTEEQPTGKTVSVEICLNPAERDEKKLRYKTVDLPTFLYTIQLPTGAGIDLTTNGIPYYHGQTYEVDQYTLTDLKSRVARCWDHEKSIHGGDENAFRKPTARHLMSPAAAARVRH
jgi:hypothetical protein